MDLDQEIDGVFKKLDQRVTDPDVACAALKQLIRTDLLSFATGPQIGDMYEFIETLFQRGSGLSSHRMKASLKTEVHNIRSQYARKPAAIAWL